MCTRTALLRGTRVIFLFITILHTLHPINAAQDVVIFQTELEKSALALTPQKDAKQQPLPTDEITSNVETTADKYGVDELFSDHVNPSHKQLGHHLKQVKKLPKDFCKLTSAMSIAFGKKVIQENVKNYGKAGPAKVVENIAIRQQRAYVLQVFAGKCETTIGDVNTREAAVRNVFLPLEGSGQLHQEQEANEHSFDGTFLLKTILPYRKVNHKFESFSWDDSKPAQSLKEIFSDHDADEQYSKVEYTNSYKNSAGTIQEHQGGICGTVVGDWPRGLSMKSIRGIQQSTFFAQVQTGDENEMLATGVDLSTLTPEMVYSAKFTKIDTRTWKKVAGSGDDSPCLFFRILPDSSLFTQQFPWQKSKAYFTYLSAMSQAKLFIESQYKTALSTVYGSTYNRIAEMGKSLDQVRKAFSDLPFTLDIKSFKSSPIIKDHGKAKYGDELEQLSGSQLKSMASKSLERGFGIDYHVIGTKRAGGKQQGQHSAVINIYFLSDKQIEKYCKKKLGGEDAKNLNELLAEREKNNAYYVMSVSTSVAHPTRVIGSTPIQELEAPSDHDENPFFPYASEYYAIMKSDGSKNYVVMSGDYASKEEFYAMSLNNRKEGTYYRLRALEKNRNNFDYLDSLLTHRKCVYARVGDAILAQKMFYARWKAELKKSYFPVAYFWYVYLSYVTLGHTDHTDNKLQYFNELIEKNKQKSKAVLVERAQGGGFKLAGGDNAFQNSEMRKVTELEFSIAKVFEAGNQKTLMYSLDSKVNKYAEVKLKEKDGDNPDIITDVDKQVRMVVVGGMMGIGDIFACSLHRKDKVPYLLVESLLHYDPKLETDSGKIGRRATLSGTLHLAHAMEVMNKKTITIPGDDEEKSFTAFEVTLSPSGILENENTAEQKVYVLISTLKQARLINIKNPFARKVGNRVLQVHDLSKGIYEPRYTVQTALEHKLPIIGDDYLVDNMVLFNRAMYPEKTRDMLLQQWRRQIHQKGLTEVPLRAEIIFAPCEFSYHMLDLGGKSIFSSAMNFVKVKANQKVAAGGRSAKLNVDDPNTFKLQEPKSKHENLLHSLKQRVVTDFYKDRFFEMQFEQPGISFLETENGVRQTFQFMAKVGKRQGASYSDIALDAMVRRSVCKARNIKKVTVKDKLCYTIEFLKTGSFWDLDGDNIDTPLNWAPITISTLSRFSNMNIYVYRLKYITFSQLDGFAHHDSQYCAYVNMKDLPTPDKSHLVPPYPLAFHMNQFVPNSREIKMVETPAYPTGTGKVEFVVANAFVADCGSANPHPSPNHAQRQRKPVLYPNGWAEKPTKFLFSDNMARYLYLHSNPNYRRKPHGVKKLAMGFVDTILALFSKTPKPEIVLEVKKQKPDAFRDVDTPLSTYTYPLGWSAMDKYLKRRKRNHPTQKRDSEPQTSKKANPYLKYLIRNKDSAQTKNSQKTELRKIEENAIGLDMQSTIKYRVEYCTKSKDRKCLLVYIHCPSKDVH